MITFGLKLYIHILVGELHILYFFLKPNFIIYYGFLPKNCISISTFKEVSSQVPMGIFGKSFRGVIRIIKSLNSTIKGRWFTSAAMVYCTIRVNTMQRFLIFKNWTFHSYHMKPNMISYFVFSRIPHRGSLQSVCFSLENW